MALPLRASPVLPHRALFRLLSTVVAACLATGLPSAGPAFAGGDPSIDALRRRLEDDDPAARASAVRRLAGALDEPSLRLVIHTLSDRHPYVRRAAAGVLGAIVDLPTRTRLLKEVPAWKEALPRAEMAVAFSAWADRDGRTGLLRALGDREPSVRTTAAEALGDDPDDSAARALLLATTDPDGLVRATALDALLRTQGLATHGEIGGSGAGDGRAGGGGGGRGRGGGPGPAATGTATRLVIPWKALSKDKDERVRLSALEGSVAMGGETALFAVEHGLGDAVWSVRLVAAELSGTVRDKRMLAPLIEVLRDPRDRVAQAAGRSLVKLTGIPFDADPVRWHSWLEGDGAAFDPSTVEPRKTSAFDPGGKTFSPVKFLDLPLASSHVTFVLDASGSMSAADSAGVSRWDRVRAELSRVLETLGTSAEGNVVVFSDDAVSLFPSAVRFSPAVREKIAKTLEGRPPAGKTALFDGIAKALDDPVVDSIVVLSDGAPSAGAHFTKTDLREELRRTNRWRHARIDVISVGTDEVAKRWRSLLKDIAEDHQGRCIGP